jgi:UDP-3-O-[3-hydroxymyristoyl] N-acetylglucosamine deacetylase
MTPKKSAPATASQTTLRRPFTLSGIGVHTGSKVTMTFLPADVDQGIVLRRSTGQNAYQEIRAVSANVVATDLSTVVGKGGVSIGTIEHLMAALGALGIDNLIVDIDGGEVPIMDGSSTAFVEAIDQAGILELDARRRFLLVKKSVRVEMGGSWGEFTPYDGTRFEIDIDFDNDVIGRQSWKGDLTAETFRDELARSRTFGFMRDVERLWAAGFALGASLENAIVIGDDEKIINADGLRFADEFARHKALDAVGDLALAGMPFIGCFRSYRGGHKLNAIALKALLDDKSAYEIVEAADDKARRPRAADIVAARGAASSPWQA